MMEHTKPDNAHSLSRRYFLKTLGASAAVVATAQVGAVAGEREKFDAGLPTTRQEDAAFWYEAPAEDWKSAIPMGNGRIGGMIFGGVQDEQVLLNESSIWCGPPAPQDNPRGPDLIARTRELLFAGKPVEAQQICEGELLDPDPGDDRCYQPLGFLHLHHESSGDVTGYRRTLDYDAAIVTTQFLQGGVAYRREALVSAPDKVLVLRYSADQRNKFSFTIGLDRPDGATVTAEGDRRLRLSGRAFAKGGGHLGARFDALVQVVAEGGTIAAADNRLKISGADSVTLLVAAASDYDFRQPEAPLTRDRLAACERQLAAAAAKTYVRLKADHVADYQRLYRRSTLQISTPSKTDAPINLRIAAAAKGESDPELLSVYFNYCRYILISASREGGLPMNLQGIWNPLMAAPWRSNWHLNINFQEAYWFAEQGNLAECHEPLFSLTEGLMRRGEVTARVMLGTKRGFNAGHRTDGTLFTAPSQHPRWGMYVAGGAWCAQHVMEHYRFTQDRDFLAKRALPILRSAALFWVDWLVPNPKTGKLVSGPATSPENTFRLPDGRTASISMGPSHDQEIAWNSLRDYLEACRVLAIANDETREAQAAIDRLALPEIAPDGRLREWPEDYAETEPGHRHLSHLWGMMPGDRITLQKTPELAEAVRKSLDYRLSHGYDAQGWSLGWVACMMARLKQGDRALDLMTHGYFGKAYPNMFVDAHGQVQVGDMMGVPLGMIELLLQSHTGEVELLPALPGKWPEGNATGLRARGGFTVDLAWKGGKLSNAVVHSITDNKGRFRYGEKLVELKTNAGESYTLSFSRQPLGR
jgi:alpha-L-fucosidase 2